MIFSIFKQIFQMKNGFRCFALAFSFAVVSCTENSTKSSSKPNSDSNVHFNNTTSAENQKLVRISENTIKSRFYPPKGFRWIESEPHSYGYFIENFKLKPYGTQILKYDGTPISTQHLHEGVLDIDIGTTDLQQCADAIMRLRAEYLWKQKKEDEIQFHFTSGDLMTWSAYKTGVRPIVDGNSVTMMKQANNDGSYENFRKYLDLIFTYSGTISLNRETQPVTKNEDLKTGDILNTPGSPGHVVFIAGVCENDNGERRYLLGEGFTPAQSIHILKNPCSPSTSPWYALDVNAKETKTARYLFEPTNFRRF